MISRRDWLRAFGLGAASASLLPSLQPRGARADTPTIPTRFIVFQAGQGIQRRYWAPTGSETDFTLNEVHAPLAKYKSDLLILEGLELLSSFYDPNGTGSGHTNGMSHCLSGDLRKKDSAGGHLWSATTIDQFIAQKLNTPTPVTRFPSLELGVSLDNNVPRMTSNGTGDYLPVEDDPTKAFAKLFPTMGPKGDARLAQDRSVLDFVARRYDSVLSRVSSIDRLRMQAHGEAIRALEKQIALVSAACAPDPGIVADTVALKAKGGGGQHWYETTADAQLRVIQTALACDLTRVASIAFWDPERSVGQVAGKIDGVDVSDFHDLVHATSNGPGGPLMTAPAKLANSPAALEIRKRAALYESSNFAKLIGLLRDVPTADGKTLLDHTVILWCTHIGWGGHELSHLPWMLAGRGGGAISTGRYVQLPRAPHPDLRGDGWFQSPKDGYVGDSKLGPAHNDLLVSIANAMGIPITTFGDARVCKGPLKQVRA